MPTVNTNLGFPPCFWLILRYTHRSYGKVLSRSRVLSYSKNTTENLFTTENAEIFDDFWKRRTRLYCMYYKRAFFIKALKYRRFGNDIAQSVSVIFHDAFWWLFFTIKNHLYAGDYAATICAIKSTQLKQGRTTRCIFFNTKKASVAVRQTIRTCVIRKTTFGTRKRYHNKQYTPKSKDQPFESERTHFDTGFNNGNVAMHRPTIIFSSSSPNHNRSIKNQNKLHQTITTNNPHNLSIKNTQRQTQQAITKKCNVFEY